MNTLKRGMFWGGHYLCHISTTSLEWNKATTKKNQSCWRWSHGCLACVSERFQLAFLSWCCRCWTYRRPPGALSLSHRGHPWQSDSGKCLSRWCGGWRSPWYRSEDWQRILAAWRGPWKPYSPWLHHLWHRKKRCFVLFKGSIERLLVSLKWGKKNLLTVKESYWNSRSKQLWLASYMTQRIDDFLSPWFVRAGLGRKRRDVQFL